MDAAPIENRPESDRNGIIPDWHLVFLFVLQLSLFLFEGVLPKGLAVLMATIFVVAATLYFLVRFLHAIEKRSPFQFGLRSLLIYTLVLAFMFGWMSRNLQQAAMQQKALRGQIMSKWEPYQDPSLRACFFRNECDLDLLAFSGDDVSDSDLQFIEKAKNVRFIHLLSDKITDDGLVHLKNAKQLTFLEIKSIRVTDKGLKHLVGLENLQELRLTKSKITTAGLKRSKLDDKVPQNQDILGAIWKAIWGDKNP